MGMHWNYQFEKVIPSQNNKNNFVVQVISSPRVQDEYIQVKFYTNKHSHSIQVNTYSVIRAKVGHG